MVTNDISIYTLSDLGVLSNLIGSLSLANEHYSTPALFLGNMLRAPKYRFALRLSSE